MFFEVVAFCEHFGEFAGEAGHFLLEGLVVLHGVFDADVAARSEDVVLLGDVCGFDPKLERFRYRALDDTIAFMEEMEREEEAGHGKGK